MSKIRKAESEERSEDWLDRNYGAASVSDGMVLIKDGVEVWVGPNVGRMPDGSTYEKPEEEEGEETTDIATGEDYFDPVVRKVDDGSTEAT